MMQRALSKGMSLRYLGMNVGEVEQIALDQKTNRITAKALINPSYMGMIAKEGTVFKVISHKSQRVELKT